MVIETLISPERVEKNFWWALLLGFALSLISIAVGYIVFPSQAGLIGLLFTTLAGLPFLRRVISIEEIKDERLHSLLKLILRSKRILQIYFAFFAGITLSYILLYFILPAGLVANLFENQLALFAFGSAPKASTALFTTIIVNNLKILLFAMILSVVYGAGAIMILTWNASAFGIFLTQINSKGVLVSLPHSLLEFAGFFLAAVAGGIVSVAAEKDKLQSPQFKTILSDGLLIFLLAVAVIVIAAALEVTIGIH